MSIKNLRILAIVATDRTFERAQLDGATVWVGKCIHCNKKLVISEGGEPLGNATIEHIWPRARGGDNAIANLALACSGCNREKGKRHDHKRADDAKLSALVDELRKRRQERWREPDDATRARLAKAFEASDDDAT